MKNANTRADGVGYPERWPWGWVHLKQACCNLGWALFEKGWAWDAFERSEWTEFASGNSVLDGMNRRATEYARRHRRQLVEAFAKAAFEGEFATGYCRIGGAAAVETMPREWWSTEDDLLRFRTFSVDPDDPLSSRVDLPCWIYVERESLEAYTNRVYCQRKGYSDRPPSDPTSDDFFSVVIEREGGPGRPGKTEPIFAHFADRLRAGTVARVVQWEGQAIYNADADNPRRAIPKTCADRIRPFHKLIKWGPGDSVLNAAEVLEAIGLR